MSGLRLEACYICLTLTQLSAKSLHCLLDAETLVIPHRLVAEESQVKLN